MAAIFEPLFTKLKPTTYQSQHLSQWLSKSWDWDLLWNPLRLSPWAQVKCSNNLRQRSQVWAWDQAKTFCEIRPSCGMCLSWNFFVLPDFHKFKCTTRVSIWWHCAHARGPKHLLALFLGVFVSLSFFVFFWGGGGGIVCVCWNFSFCC